MDQENPSLFKKNPYTYQLPNTHEQFACKLLLMFFNVYFLKCVHLNAYFECFKLLMFRRGFTFLLLFTGIKSVPLVVYLN